MTTPSPLRILTVCTGNICRSPAAERVLASGLGPLVQVHSAGTGAVVGHPIHQTMAELMSQAGIYSHGFAAQAVTEDLVQDADLVLPLTLDHRERVLDFAPAAVRRTFTLLEFAHLVSTLDVSGLDETLTPGERLRVLVPRAGLARAKTTPPGGYDVPDPFGRGPEDFALAWSLIQDAADAIVRAARGR